MYPMPLSCNIRKETPSDYNTVFKLIKEAFQAVPFSDLSEPYLVRRLRNSDAFIPELSLVADLNGQIVGHILLTKITIQNEYKTFESLALAPVSVLPGFQNKGIGHQLIKKAHQIAKAMGYKSIVLIGHEKYYPRFGYKKTSKYNIKLPFAAPEKNCMVVELIDDYLNEVSGTVIYPKEFYG